MLEMTRRATPDNAPQKVSERADWASATRECLISLCENTPDLILIVRADGSVVYVNRSARRLLGLDNVAAPYASGLWDVTSAREYRRLLEEAMTAAADGQPWHGKSHLIGSNGDELPVSMVISACTSPCGSERLYSLIARNIEVEQRRERLLLYHATHDLLTGLPNRLLLNDRIDQAVAHARRNGQLTAVLFMDLDRFKEANDALGHQAADEVLRQVGMRLQQCLRQTDTVGRYGGDEFVVVLHELRSRDEIDLVLDKVRGAFETPFMAGSGEVTLDCSIGVSVCPDDGWTTNALLGAADQHMYRQKERRAAARRRNAAPDRDV